MRTRVPAVPLLSGRARTLPGPAALVMAMIAITAVPAPPALAGDTVFGKTHSQRCFQAASRGHRSFSAIEACDRALESEPLKRTDKAATLSNRGVLYARRGRHEQAINDYDRALQLEPSLVHALINRGNAYLNLKRYKQALTDYDRALTFSQGREPLVFFNRSIAYEKLGRKAEAREDLVRALQLQPESRRIREALAELE